MVALISLGIGVNSALTMGERVRASVGGNAEMRLTLDHLFDNGDSAMKATSGIYAGFHFEGNSGADSNALLAGVAGAIFKRDFGVGVLVGGRRHEEGQGNVAAGLTSFWRFNEPGQLSLNALVDAGQEVPTTFTLSTGYRANLF